MHVFDRLYIGGSWVRPHSSATIDVVDPATEATVGRIPAGDAADVDAAVAAARRGFLDWSARSVADRAEVLERLAALLDQHAAELAELIATEMGAPLKIAARVQVGLPQTVLRSSGQVLREFNFEERIGNSLVVREPIGVVGCITPWNYPLHQVVAKLAPALAAGCTVVLKPSEVAPLSAFRLAQLVEQVDLPAGAFNLVSGYGPVVGEAIAAHPGVDMVSFTGSTRAGRRVAELAAPTVKRVALELGGKSAAIVLEDADVEKAVTAVVRNCCLNSGQTCTALTRLLVPQSRLAEAERAAATAAEWFSPGSPFEATTTLGPLVSAAQRDRVTGYIKTGVAEGARVLTGGAEPPDGLEKGYFVKPTVFTDVRNDMAIAQEEIFGPVLAIIPYSDEEQAVALANDTVYGLAGSVWGADVDHALAVARRLRTGQVEVNGGPFNPDAPFGGYRQSGNGRELGRFGLEEFLEVKSLQLPVARP
ncbi:MAG TPA: aldehyde dehydrogenase family protein [Candidatus Dormibacteraeota bacterium]